MRANRHSPSSRGLISAFVMVIVVPTFAIGQGQPPADVALARSMADEMRRLADDILTDRGRSPQGRQATEDTRELGQALEEYAKNRNFGFNPMSASRAFVGLGASWDSLRAELASPALATPRISRGVARVDAVNDALVRALGINVPPPDFGGGPRPPAGNGSIRRLAHSVVDRAEGLVVAIQADLGRDPNAAGLLADASDLAREADAWHDGLKFNTGPTLAARSFGSVDVLAHRIERVITRRPMPPRVTAAWQAFSDVEQLVHREIGLPAPPPIAPSTYPGFEEIIGRPRPRPQPLVRLADQLLEQSNEFVRVFTPTAGNVPEGRLILSDGQRLAAAATAFRQDVARGGDPNALAARFRNVDAIWQRLARRVNRIAGGRTGPNIQQVARIGGISEMIRRSLGLPGANMPFGP